MVISAFQNVGRGILGASVAGDAANQDFTPIPNVYALYEAYYANHMYRRDGVYHDKRTGLPVTIRAIHNPVTRVVDWYAGRVSPGAWTADGLPINGKPNRIPFGDDTGELIRLAVQQVFSWGAAGFDMGLYVRTGAKLGDVFAEVVSDVERQKVYPKLIHPRFVTDIEWNDSGDVVRYRVEIPMQDESGRNYTWGKIVDKETVTTLKDGKPHGYDGQPETIDNPWGFVPAIWVQHRNNGGQHGDPCFAGVLGKIDELNGIVSEIDDYILRFTKQKVIIGTENVKEFMDALSGSNVDRSSEGDPAITAAYVNRKRESQPVTAGKGPITAIRMIENMGLAEAVPHRDRLKEEIEADLPEITLSDKLLAMQQVTAPGAVPLVQDVQHRLDEAAANYDAGIVKLGQMCISMAAQCIASGIWERRSLTAQQQRFLPFSVDSFDRGELTFSISPRTLIPETLDQKIAQAAGVERLGTLRSLRLIGIGDKESTEQLAQNREAAQYDADLSGRLFSAGF